jgi:sugar lactone lactonase YvrE
MIEIQMLRHGNRALASAQTRFFRKAAERMGLAMTLALLSVVFCSAAAAQTAHFSWVQANLGGWFDNSVGIAVDASGNVYVSLNGATTVEEIVAVNGVIPPSPTILTLGGGFDYPIGLAVDSSGNVYVADSFNAAVKKIPPGCATSACVAPLGGGFVFPVGVALDAAGNVYVIDDIAGDDTALLKEIPVGCALAACVNTVAGGFFDPRGVAVDSHGNAYIADTENHAVKEVEAVGGSIPASPTIRTLAAGNFPYPEGVAVDSSGDVYVADGSSDQVIEILAFSGSIPVSPTLIPLGSGLKSDIEQAQGIALDAAGNVYVADLSSVREISFSSSGPSFNLGAANVNSATGTITLGYTFDSAGEIAAPVVVTQGSAGLDFADAKTGTCTTNGTSHSYSAGNICTVDVTLTPATWGPRYGAVELYGNSANLLATNYVYGTGVGPQAIFPAAGWLAGIGSGFANPTGLAVDAGGNLYVADPANLLLSKIAPSGSVTALPAGTGPYSVAIDGAGNLFVTETGANPGVFEIPAAGGYQTINELSGAAGYYDLRGIALDVNGNVFVAAYDYGNVYELTAASGYSTIKDLAPTITFAIGIAVDLNGNVFVSDDQDHFVGEIPAPDYSTLKVLNNSLDIWYPKGIALDGNDNIYATSMFGLQEILASSNYATVKTLAGNVSGIQSVALDGSGNIYYTVEDGANVAFMNRWLGPDLTFAATAEGSTSSDSPQTVTVENSGNATLDFLAIGYPENFPQDHPAKDDCYSGGSLEAGASCNFAVGFAPLSLGPLISAVALVDNSLYAPGYAVQYVSVTGTGLIPQAITFTDSLPSSANYSAGLAYTLSATGGGSGNSVTFSILSGPATLAGSALTITGAGTVVVAANQLGNATYAAAPQATQSITIKIAAQTINFPAIAGTHYAETQLTLSATASSGLPVTFTSQTPSVCTVAGATASLLTQGTCIIRATQAGSATWAPAVFVQQNVTVHLNAQTITFPAITATEYILGQVPLSATASSGLAVSFASATSSVCTVAGTTASLIATGTCVIHATQAGNSAYTPAPLVSQSFVVHINPQTISFPAITGTQYALTQLTLSATATSGLTVSFASTTPSICTVASGKASLLLPGTCILQATQAGNADYSAATLVQQNVVVHLAPQTINFPAIASQIVGAKVTLSATASSGLTVAFASATGTVCSVTGTTATMLTTGTCVIHATQTGSSVYSAAPLVSQSFLVKAN